MRPLRTRRAGDAEHTLSAATNLLAIDPLNEEGVLGRAEALALAGQKAEALRSLDEYARDVGALSPDLRVPADILRKRIAERTPPVRTDYPLIGRSKELDELLQFAREAASGRVVIMVLLGDAGIGKTRLLSELRAHLSLKPVLIALARCRPHDGSRPMGPLLDVLPVLLQARGALGVSEESHAILRAIQGDDNLTAGRPSSDWASQLASA